MIVSFGELLLRLSAPGYTKLFQRDSFDLGFCGGEANVAISLANFGLKSSFVTKIPDSDIGRSALNSLRAFGVNTDQIIYGDGRLGIYYFERGSSQRPSKVIYDRRYSTISMATRREFDWENIFKGAKWFHWTGINPALGGEMPEICEDACKFCKKNGIMVSCDLNYRNNLWSSEKAKSIMEKLMHYVDICIANEEDADKALGIRMKNSEIGSGNLDKSEYILIAEQICAKYGCKKVAFTFRESHSASINGWSAMLYDSNKRETYHSKEYSIHIVDRVGAGDSFAAGLIYSLITGKNNKETIEFSTAASCLKHTIEGDFNRSSISDVENLLKNGGNGRVIR